MHDVDLHAFSTEKLYALQKKIELELQARCETERARLHDQMQELATRYRVDVAYFQAGFPKKRGRPHKAKANGSEAREALGDPSGSAENHHGIARNA